MAKKHDKLKDMPELTPEEMKAIGEIELGPSRHEKFLNAHYKKLIVATLAIMLLMAAAIIYATYRMRQKAEASGLLVQALGVVDVSAADENASMATLEHIINDYSDTQAAGTAQLLRGMRLVEGGEEKKGLQTLQQVAMGAEEPFIRLRAQVFMAGYYMKGGENEKAAELWQTVSRAGDTPYQALALLSLGDLAQKNGDEQGARTYYTQIAERCPASPLQAAAQQRLLILGVDAPKPVSPPEPQKSEEQHKGDLLFPGIGSPLN